MTVRAFSFSTKSIIKTILQPGLLAGKGLHIAGAVKPQLWTAERIAEAFSATPGNLSFRGREEEAALAAFWLWPDNSSAAQVHLALRVLACLNTGDHRPVSIIAALHQIALADFEAERFEQAAMSLCCVLSLAAREDAASELGLALCAIGLDRMKEARILASHCVLMDPKDARAQYVAGTCHLETGDRKAAQAHLALAARLGRSDPSTREEVRMAQQMLLSLHFA